MNVARSLLVGSTIAGAVSIAGATVMLPTKSVPIPRPDAVRIERIACSRSGGSRADKIVAYVFDVPQSESRAIYAEVTCHPHGRVNGYPLRTVASCDNAKGAWACATLQAEVEVETHNRKILVHPMGVSPEIASQIALDVASSGWFPSRPLLGQDLTSPCDVETAGVGTWRITCHLWSATIDRVCGKEPCPFRVWRAARVTPLI